MKKSIYEILKEKWNGPPELRGFNPLRIQIGPGKLLEKTTQTLYNVFCIAGLKLDTNPTKKIDWCEYYLNEEHTQKLLVDDWEKCILFNKVDTIEYNDNFYHEIILGQFKQDMPANSWAWVDDPKYVGDIAYYGTEYRRPDGIRIAHGLKQTKVFDIDHSGNISSDETEIKDFYLFDYNRVNEDGDTEWLHVMMDINTGYMEFWIGVEKSSDDIVVMG